MRVGVTPERRALDWRKCGTPVRLDSRVASPVSQASTRAENSCGMRKEGRKRAWRSSSCEAELRKLGKGFGRLHTFARSPLVVLAETELDNWPVAGRDAGHSVFTLESQMPEVFAFVFSFDLPWGRSGHEREVSRHRKTPASLV